jgi:hypothetical protein
VGNLTAGFNGGGAMRIGSAMRLKSCGSLGFVDTVNGAPRGGTKAWNGGGE